MRRTFPLLLAALAVLTGCGGDDERAADTRPRPKPKNACALVPPADIRRALARPPRTLKATPDDSYELTACIYRGGGGAIKLRIDTASRPLDRYFWALTERQQFYGDNPKLAPRNVKGVGEDSAIGTAAANWVPSIHQLAAYGWDRLVKVDVDVPAYSDAAARRSAVRIARIAFKRRGR